jgi:hypothetical protein
MGTQILKEQSAASVALPPAGKLAVFPNSSNSSILSTKDSAGNVRPVGVGTADELATTGAAVDVSAANPPNPGDRLRANTPTAAVWSPDFNVVSVQVGGPYAASFDDYVRADVTGVPFQLDLPAVHTVGQKIGAKIVGLATNPYTIDGNGNTIDGAATLVMSTNNEWAILISDGTNWSQVS